MYRLPPLTLASGGNVTGAALVAIAAPGAGLALRIVGGVIVLTHTSPAGQYRVLVRDPAPATFVWDASLEVGGGGDPTSPLVIPEPGIQLPANTRLEVTGLGPAGAIGWTFFYFIDAL